MNNEEKKPFHLAIVDVLRDCASTDFVGLSSIIKATKIPDNHDAIIQAWEKRIKDFRYDKDFGVPASVEEQKRACQKAKV